MDDDYPDDAGGRLPWRCSIPEDSHRPRENLRSHVRPLCPQLLIQLSDEASLRMAEWIVAPQVSTVDSWINHGSESH